MADPEIALGAVAGGLLGLLRMCQRHPGRVTEATVDQLAEAVLRLLGVGAPRPPASPPSRSPYSHVVTGVTMLPAAPVSTPGWPQGAPV